MKVTPSDVVTFDTAGILGYPLFGDTTNPAPLGASISYAGPVHGYAFVDDNSDQLAGGYWIELDLANGGAIGDYGIASTEDDGDFDNNGISKASMLGSGNDTRSNHVSSGNLDTTAAPVNFWPTSVASTVFTVTPMGSAMRDSDNSPTILQVFNATPVQGAYDRNENGVDGTVPITVRCVGRVTPAQLMPGVVANAAWAAQGGWGYLVNLGNNDNTFSRTGDYDAIVYQVDTSSAAGKFMAQATRIVGDTGQK